MGFVGPGRFAAERILGPRCFEEWEMAWTIFTNTMIALGAASHAALGRYAAGIKLLSTRYPTAWGDIAAYDERMRGE